MLQTARNALTARVLDLIYPPRCLACPSPTESSHGLCGACWRETHFIQGATCHACGVPLLGEAVAGDLCESCTRHPPAWDRGAAALIYSGAARRMVLAYKHGDRLDMTRPLAAWMSRAGRDVIAASDLIAPVPLHWRRLLRRRYNQAAELARAISRESGTPAIPDLLQRPHATTPQQKMNREARLANQSGAYRLHPRHAAALPGRTVLLVDDVLTSGATLSACADVLRAGGAARVNVLVLCRVAFAESKAILEAS